MSELLKFLLATLKPWLGNLTITVDREKRIVYFEQKGQVTELTYDQVIDRVEELFNGKTG